MFQAISSFFVSLTVFVGGILGVTSLPQPEVSVATSTQKIEQVISTETTATKKTLSTPVSQPKTKKDEPAKDSTQPQAPKTFSTPSGAILDENGNVLYSPPQQPKPPQIYTLPLPKGSVIDESGNVLYVPPPEKKYICRTENTAPSIPLTVKELPWGEYGAFRKDGAIIQQFATRGEALAYAEANGEVDKSKNKNVCGWE